MSAAVASATGFSTGANITALTATVTLPSGAMNGDVIVIFVNETGSGLTWSVPNFTAVTAASGTNCSCQVLYRILDGSGNDPGATFTITESAGGQFAGTCMRVTGASNTSPFDPAPTSGQVNASSTNITAPGITTTVNGDLLIWGGCDRVPSGTPNAITLPAGYTDSGAGQSSSSAAGHSNSGNIAGYIVQGSAGATGNIVGTEGSATANGAVLLGMQAAAAVTAASNMLLIY
jgi:hypothetical protein